MKKFIDKFKRNLDIFTFILISIFIELFAITYTTCGFYLSKPLYPILILMFFVCFLNLFKNKVIRLV